MKGHKQTNIQLVQLDYHDIQELIELSASVGWDYDEGEINTLLGSGSVFGHKNQQGKLVSSAAIIPYDTKLASIGMVIVHKDYRGLGLAKIVTQKCIDSVSTYTTIMLIATEEGKPVYEKLGFVSIDSVHKYLCDHYESTILKNSISETIVEYQDKHFIEVLRLDGAALGAERSEFLKNRINQSKQSFVAKDQSGKVIGYGLAIPGPVNLVLGPIVAPNTDIAVKLVERLASNHKGRLRIDVPSGKENFMFVLEQKGFIKVTNPPIMIKISTQLPTRNHSLYSIASQAYG